MYALAIIDFTMVEDNAPFRHNLPTVGTWTETGSTEDRTVTVVAELTEDEYYALMSEWGLDSDASEPNMGILCEYGHLAADAWNINGMDFNVSGVTDVENASIYVSVPFDVD